MADEFLACTTELEAINSILASVGESPINSLDGLFVDAGLAQNLLKQESRRVQTLGWTFNTDVEVTLTPAIDGTITLPLNTLRVITPGDDTLVQRGSKLYDRVNHTYVFSEPITGASLITGLLFEELPEAIRQFVLIRAGRRFQDVYGSDRVVHEFQARDEQAAWASALNYEAEIAQYNMIDNSYLATRMKLRRPASTFTRAALGWER